VTGVDEQFERRKAALKKYADLKARAEHPNTPPAEAEVAFKMAAKVMADWEIDELELVAAKGATPSIVMRMIRLDDVKSVLADELIGIAAGITRAFECQTLIHHYDRKETDLETGEARIPGTYMEVVGYSHDVAMAQELYYVSVLDMRMKLGMEKQQDRYYQREFAKGYIERVVDRIRWEIVQARKERVDAGVSSSVALAVRNQRELVKDFFADLHAGQKFGSYKPRGTDRYDANARARGRKAADGLDLSRRGKIAGGSQKPLGTEKKGLGRG